MTRLLKIIVSITLLLLVSCASNNLDRSIAEIPSLKECPTLLSRFFEALDYKTPKDIKRIRRIVRDVYTPEEFINAVLKIKDENVDVMELVEQLKQTPYARKMSMTTNEALQTLQEVIYTRATTFEQAKEIFIRQFPVYQYGTKKFSNQREYDRVIKVLKIKNQCQFGSCWAYAAMSRMERELSNKVGEDVALSADHFYASYIFNEIKTNVVMGKVPENLFRTGNNISSFEAMAPLFGVLPESAFVKKTNFTSDKKEEFLKQLRKAIKPFNKKVKRGSFTQQDEKDLHHALQDVIKTYVGELKPSFKFQGKMYTPHSFYEEFFDNKTRVMNIFTRGPPFDVNTNRAEYSSYLNPDKPMSKSMTYSQTPLEDEQIEQIIISSIDNNQALYYSFNIPENTFRRLFGKTKTILDRQSGLATMEHTKESVSRGYHAVVIVGYELDLRGNLKTLKIQNSWGDKWGDEGILHMDRSFFWRHFETIAQIK